MKPTKSLKFIDKLNARLMTDPAIEEDLQTLFDITGSFKSFKSQQDLNNHLSEGSLLNITKIASRALSIPCGDYVVWTTDSGTTMLVPTIFKPQEVFENQKDKYEIHTPNLIKNWAIIQKVLEEDDIKFGEEDNNKDSDHSDPDDKDEDLTDVSQRIQMTTVDRTPIVRAMEQHGHTVTSLAAACNVDPPAISRILRIPKDTEGDPGGRNPSIGLAALIANELKMDAEALFPDIFGTPNADLKARETPANRGSGQGSRHKGHKTNIQNLKNQN